MTDEEYEQVLADEEATIARNQAIAEAEAKKATALAKLQALGLTTDDLKALGL